MYYGNYYIQGGGVGCRRRKAKFKHLICFWKRVEEKDTVNFFMDNTPISFNLTHGLEGKLIALVLIGRPVNLFVLVTNLSEVEMM